MNRHANTALVALCMVCAVSRLMARQVSDPAKRDPPPRSVGVPDANRVAPDQDRRPGTELPKIELPEYIITGVESIDLPAVQKMIPSEQGVFISGGGQGPGSREAFDVSPRLAARTEREAGALPETRARLSASVGTFTTPRAEGWFGQRYESFDYGVSGAYFKTNGFDVGTNRSGGSATLDGGYLLSAESPLFDAARLSGLFGYSSDTYRLYGSSGPSLKRTTDGVRFDAGFSSSIKSPWQYRAGFTYSTFAVKESTLSARQNLAEFTAAADIPTEIVPLVADVDISLATRSALIDENTSMVRLGIESQRAWWNSFFAQVGVRLYIAKGMADQKLTRLYPSMALGYRFPSVHTAMVGYQGEVRFSALDELIRTTPYLSSSAPIRHVNVPLHFMGMLESEWSDAVVTRLTLRWEQHTDEPLLSDSTQRGVWDLEYLGTTTRLEGELEAFANISSNDYFAVSIVGRSSNVSETSVGIPYLPEAEVSLLYRHEFPVGVAVVPRLSVFGRRNTTPRAQESLKGYAIAGVRAEYSPLESLTVFADIDNLLDVRYEVWKGYRGHPFLMTAGVSYSW